ncbi:MAG: pentapeptide repeat-containing protein [SAR324 cluster bacterium]|nr:pentapeptide repeat-containing protein [SAR324 cluster bacterium]
MLSFLSLNFLLLLFFFVLTLCVMVYFSQSEDRKLLEIAPEPRSMPNMELELVHRDLKLFLKKYNKLNPIQRTPLKAELFELENKLNQIRVKTQGDYNKYKRTGKELKAAWQDYFETFFQNGFLSRSLYPRIHQEIHFFKVHFKAAKNRHITLEAKLAARERIWLQEGKNKTNEAEIKAFINEAHLNQSGAIDMTPLTAVFESPTTQKLTSESLVKGVEKGQIVSTHEGKIEILISMLPKVANFTFTGGSLDFNQGPLGQIQNASFANVSLVGSVLLGETEISASQFYTCDFSNSKFQKGVKRFINCQFINCKFVYSALEEVSFYDCIFEGCDFRGSKIDNVKFIGSKLQNCMLDEVDFSKAILPHALADKLDE